MNSKLTQLQASEIVKAAIVALSWILALADPYLAQLDDRSEATTPVVVEQGAAEIAPSDEILPAIPAVDPVGYDAQILENARAGTAEQRMQFLETVRGTVKLAND